MGSMSAELFNAKAVCLYGLTRRNVALIALAFGLTTHANASELARPDALLQIDMNRVAVVERIVSSWGGEVPTTQRESFRSKLMGLRADQLLAANLSGSFDGVLEQLQGVATNAAPSRFSPALGSSASAYANLSDVNTALAAGALKLNASADQAKATGELDRDLVYTPVTPCRLFDTRTGQPSALGTVGGAIANNTQRTISAGGACGIPAASVKSIMLSFHAATNNPPVLGIISFTSPGAPISAMAATWTGGVWVTGTFVAPTNTTSQFNVFVGNGSAMQADFVADVVGYFSPPNRSGDGLRVATTTFANTVLVTNGSSANSISATSPGSTIGGGGSSATTTTVPNIPASDTFTFGPNQIIGNAPASTIAGGNRNVIEQSNLAVNTAFSTIGGGHNNRVNAYFGTIAGGISNVAGQTTFNVFGATVSGGFGNNAYSSYATIGGGSGNQAGFYSVAPGGFGNVVASNFSFGAGRGARTDDVTNPGTRYDGVFIWADSNGASSTATQNFHANAQDQFAVRARGGVAFRVVSTNTAGAGAGCTLPAGGAASWTCSSDRNLKEAVQNISPRAILAKVSALPLSTWQFIGTNRRHLGPMAQDFRAAFGLGEDDKHITTADVSGVALAAIQGLNEKLMQKDAEISKLKSKAAKVDKLEAELAVIKRKLGL